MSGNRNLRIVVYTNDTPKFKMFDAELNFDENGGSSQRPILYIKFGDYDELISSG